MFWSRCSLQHGVEIWTTERNLHPIRQQQVQLQKKPLIFSIPVAPTTLSDFHTSHKKQINETQLNTGKILDLVIYWMRKMIQYYISVREKGVWNSRSSIQFKGEMNQGWQLGESERPVFMVGLFPSPCRKCIMAQTKEDLRKTDVQDHQTGKMLKCIILLWRIWTTS